MPLDSIVSTSNSWHQHQKGQKTIYQNFLDTAYTCTNIYDVIVFFILIQTRTYRCRLGCLVKEGYSSVVDLGGRYKMRGLVDSFSSLPTA